MTPDQFLANIPPHLDTAETTGYSDMAYRAVTRQTIALGSKVCFLRAVYRELSFRSNARLKQDWFTRRRFLDAKAWLRSKT